MTTSKRVERTAMVVAKRYPDLGSNVGVAGLVEFVLKTWRNTAPRKKPNDDQRDIMNWSDLLEPLSAKDLQWIINMRRSDVKFCAKKCIAPFNKVQKKFQGFFATQLSGREIIEVARYRLDVLEGRD